MPETVKDLTVRLAFEHGDTKSQIAAIKNEIKLLESDFAAAAAAAGGFSSGLNETGARSQMLQQQIALQEQAVQKYGTAIEAQKDKIKSAQERQQEYAQKLDQAKAKYTELASEIDRVKAAMEEQAASTGKESAEYQQLAQQLDQLESEYKQNDTAMKGWDRGIKKCSQTIANADKEVQRLTTAQNESKAAIGRMKQELDGLNSKLDQHKAKLKQASEAMKDFGDKAKSAGQWQTQVGSTMNKATTAIVGAGVAAAGAAIQWESSFADVEKTVSGTTEQLKEIETGLIDMSKTKPIDNTTLAGIAANAGQLGIWTDNVLEFTGVMADLSNTTNLTAEEGASAFAKFANITGMAQTQFSNMGSTVVELGNNMATTESDIVNMATGLASAGHQVGMTNADILGVAAGLSSLGLEAQAGGTAFSRLLVNMQVAAETGSSDLKKFAEVAGMSASDFKAAFQADAAGAVTQFIQGLSNGSKSAIAILDEMGIKETRFRDMLLRTSNASDLFSNAIAMANNAWDDNTALAKEAAVRYNTTASQMTILGNKAKATAINFGNDLKPMVDGGVEWASGMLDRFNAMDGAQRRQIMTWGAYAAAVGPTFTIVGKANTVIGNAATGLSKLTAAAAAAGGGFGGFASAVSTLLGPAGVAALIVATGAVVYKFAEWASGAKAAREATEALNRTAKEWSDTQAQTIYDTGTADPLARFGLNKDSFATGIKDSQTWFDSLVDTWTDGKSETRDTVKQFADSFAQSSDGVREAIQGQQTLLDGYEALTPEARSRMDADLDQLNKWDKEVADLLRKRQNGKLSDADQARLNEIIKARAELEIEYKLDKGSGYDQIITQMQADVERAKASGQVDSTVIGDTMNALAEGRKAYSEALADSYRSEYANIQAIEDETARTQALDKLNQQYQQRRQQGEQAYNDAVLEAGRAAMESGDFQGQIDMINQLMAELGKGEDIDLPKVAELTEGLDEGQLTSLISLMEQLKAAGMSDEELTAGFGAGLDSMKTKIEAIRDLSKDLEGLDGLGEMLGEALPQEVQRIMVGLDMTEAATDWEKFAAGGSLSPIKANAEVEAIDAEGIPVNGSVQVSAKATVTLNPLDLSALAAWKAANAGKELEGPPAKVSVKLGDNWQSELSAALEAGKLTVSNANGIKVSVTPEVLKKIGPQDLAMVDSDGTLHVVMTPEWGTSESLAQTSDAMNQQPGAGTPLAALSTSTQQEVGYITELNAALAETRQLAEEAANAGDKRESGILSERATAIADQLRSQLQGLSDVDLSNIGTRMNDLIAALSSGEGSPDEIAAWKDELESLKGVVEAIEPGTFNQTGTDVAEGIAEGMTSYSFSGDGAEVANGILDACNSALGAHSPATKMIPTGSDVAEGIGKGMTEYDFGGDASALSSALLAALEGSLTPDQFQASGQLIGQGLAAGIAEADVSSAGTAMSTNLQTGISGALNASTLQPAGTEAAAGIAQGMSSFSYAGTCAGIVSGITSGFSGLAGQGNSIGAQFGAGLAAGLNARIPSIIARARSAANQISSAFRSAWQIHSPSKVAENLTTMFGKGLERGMDKWPTVSQKLLEDDVALAYGYSKRAGEAVGNSSTTNNNNNSVNLNVQELKVNDKQDVETMAYGIANLTRRTQRSKGLR